MRVLIISHTYVARINQTKLDELASLPDVVLQVIVPTTWRDGPLYVLRAEVPDTKAYSYRPLHIVSTPAGRHVYLSLDLTMRRFKPDIVYVEEPLRGPTMLQACLYRDLWAPRSRIILFTWENLEFPLSFLASNMGRFNLSRVDHVICGNKDGVGVLRARGYSGPISVIPQLGIDTRVFSPGDGSGIRRELNLSKETFVIGFIGRMVPEKGLTFLVEAAAPLKGDWTILAIGNGPEREKAFAKAQELGIASRLRTLGSIPHEALAFYLGAMDVLVSPSLTLPRWKEQFGLALAQAMSSQVAVIGSTCGETPNLIKDAGLIFPEGDAKSLVECLKRLQEDKVLRSRLGRKGAERIRQEFSFRRIAERTHQVWKECLNGH